MPSPMLAHIHDGLARPSLDHRAIEPESWASPDAAVVLDYLAGRDAGGTYRASHDWLHRQSGHWDL